MGMVNASGSSKQNSSPSSSLALIIARLALLFAIDTLAFWIIYNLFENGHYPLMAAFLLVTALVNFVILYRDIYPLRWMLIGLVLMSLFAIYPIVYTVFVAFTNFGDGHLLTKDQALDQITSVRYLPEGGFAYNWTAYRNDDGQFALWLQSETEPGLLALPGETIQSVTTGEAGVGELDEDGIPTSIDGYERLNRLTVVRYINELGEISFGSEERIVQIRTLDDAAELQSRYVYDLEQDILTDQETGAVFRSVNGTFVGPGGQELRPGFSTTVGFTNFERFFNSPALRGPLVRIISWNFAFALISVFSTFALGLTIAFIYNDRTFPGRKIIQSFLLIPYTIPSLITILIWRGLLNPEVGIVNRMLESFISYSPPWFTDQWWAKAGVLLVNLWLGYPYFMLICSGALQAIPEDIYRAAEVDGANPWQRFRLITLPLLLVAVGPLLVASFTFNFNNFNLIFLFVQGGPPIAGAATRAGHTDILISYVYNLAFAGGRGADYGLASAVTIIIFFIVAAITLFQFRYTRMWEEVRENV
jgi:ABC-type sugar transport system permease subunit